MTTPYWKLNNSNASTITSGNRYNRNYNNNNNIPLESNILDEVSYPWWDGEEWEETTQNIIDTDISQNVLTRKMVNNAFEGIFAKSPENLKKAKANRKPVWQHVYEGNIKDVKQYIDAGYDINDKLRENITLLHLAVINKKNNEAMVKLLVDAGANINAVNDFNLTPLHMALSIGLNNVDSVGFPRSLWNISNYLLDQGAFLNPPKYGTMTNELIANQMNRIALVKFGKTDVTVEDERKALTEHGLTYLNMYYGVRDLFNRIVYMEDEFVRVLHFYTMASTQPKSILLDERCSIRMLKEYVKFWILDNMSSELDLLIKQPGGKPDRILDLDKTIKEEGLNEDSQIKLVVRLRTYANVYGGRRRGGKTRKHRKH